MSKFFPSNKSLGLIHSLQFHAAHNYTHTHAQLECTLHKKFNVAVVLFGMVNMGIKFFKVSVLSFTKTFYSLTIMFLLVQHHDAERNCLTTLL